jgi:hypothetical protein
VTVGGVHLDAFTQGLLVYTAAAVLAGRIVGMSPAGIGLVAAAGWIPWLLAHNPRLGAAAAAFACWLAVHRYGWRHVAGTVVMTTVFCGVLWGRVTSRGLGFGAALVDATISTFWLAFLAGACLGAYRLASRGIDHLAGYGYAQETRRVQQLAEHKRAMGLGRRGLTWAGRKAKAAITPTPRPAPQTITGAPPRQLPAGGQVPWWQTHMQPTVLAAPPKRWWQFWKP